MLAEDSSWAINQRSYWCLNEDMEKKANEWNDKWIPEFGVKIKTWPQENAISDPFI